MLRQSSVSVATRIVLSFISLFSVWTLHTLIVSTILHKESLALWTGGFCLFSYVLFVIPTVSLFSAEQQLRHWYLLVTGSVVWAIGLISLVFRSSPVEILRPPYHSNLLLRWTLEFAILAAATYLVVLSRVLH